MQLFGQSYQHPSGLQFKTLAYDRESVDVTITCRPKKQLSIVPFVKLSSRKVQSDSSSRYAKTYLSAVLDRENSGIDQTVTGPFALSNLLRVKFSWENFTNSADEDDLVLVGPSRITAGSDEPDIDLEEYSTNLETFTPSITV